MPMPILAPAAVLALWTMIMLLWMLITRVPALARLDPPPKDITGARGSDLEGLLPREVMWKSHNYTHLMEQPTVFYAVVLILAVLGQGNGINAKLAWAYVGLRVVHSLWQALVNSIPVRATLFVVTSIILTWLCINAVRTALGF